MKGLARTTIGSLTYAQRLRWIHFIKCVGGQSRVRMVSVGLALTGEFAQMATVSDVCFLRQNA